MICYHRVIVACSLFMMSGCKEQGCTEDKMFILEPLGICLDVWLSNDTPQDTPFLVNNKGIFSPGTTRTSASHWAFPLWFRSLLETKVFSSGTIPGSSQWIGWLRFEERKPVVYFVSRPDKSHSQSNRPIDIVTVVLPENSTGFGFLKREKKEPIVFSVTPKAVLRLHPSPHTAGTPTLLATLTEREHPQVTPLPWPTYFDRVMDVDGDGLDDLLLPSTLGSDIYLQTNNELLTCTGRIDLPWKVPTWIVDMINLDSLPRSSISDIAMWMEPASDSRFPCLVLIGDRSLVKYHQAERGKFLPAKPEIMLGQIVQRDARKCIRSRDEGEIILTSTLCMQTNVHGAVIIHAQHEPHQAALYLKDHFFLPRMVDLDRNSQVELFLPSFPPIAKLINMNTFSNQIELTGSFLSYSPAPALRWSETSDRLPLGHIAASAQSLRGWNLNNYVEDRLVIGPDFDQDGFGDVAFGSDRNVRLLLLCSKNGIVSSRNRIDLSVPSAIRKILPLQLCTTGATQLLIQCSPATEGNHNIEGDTFGDYFILSKKR